jgi:hypothetical protein
MEQTTKSSVCKRRLKQDDNSKTLAMLSEGDRVWVNIPKTGYVGVGEVIGEKTRLEEYRFAEQDNKTLLELDTKGDYHRVNVTLL